MAWAINIQAILPAKTCVLQQPINIYTINGLPPTPIALPSKKAIEATMHPDNEQKHLLCCNGQWWTHI